MISSTSYGNRLRILGSEGLMEIILKQKDSNIAVYSILKVSS